MTGNQQYGGVPHDLLLPGEAAALLRVDPRTVTKWAAAGRIWSVRTLGGRYRLSRSQILAIARGDETPWSDR